MPIDAAGSPRGFPPPRLASVAEAACSLREVRARSTVWRAPRWTEYRERLAHHGQRDGERSSVPVDDEVVLAARPRSVNRRGSGVSPPLRALTCEASIAASSVSSRPSARSSASRTSCRSGPTPASVQSRRRRQAVTPLHPTSAVRPASSHSCEARKRSRAEQHGHPSATAPG